MESTKQQPQQQQQQQQQFTSSAGSQNDIDQPSALLGQSPSSTVMRQSESSSTPSSSGISALILHRFRSGSRLANSSLVGMLGRRGMSESPTPLSDRGDSIREAIRLQNEFDNEDRALSAQRAELAESAQRLFECGICMEKKLYDSIARPDPCGHDFCRDCLRGHVTARIDERRFPILCPTCTAGKDKGKETAGGT